MTDRESELESALRYVLTEAVVCLADPKRRNINGYTAIKDRAEAALREGVYGRIDGLLDDEATS